MTSAFGERDSVTTVTRRADRGARLNRAVRGWYGPRIANEASNRSRKSDAWQFQRGVQP